MLELFGQVAADVLMEKIDTTSRSSSSRYVIDSLPDAERCAVFDALRKRAHRKLAIPVDSHPHELYAVATDHVDVIPLLVTDNNTGSTHQNVVSDGWACKLRDHYTSGAIATRPRALLTLTAEGNETQRSASESAVDRDLLPLSALAIRLLARHGIVADDPRTKAIETYVQRHNGSAPMNALAAQMERFLVAADQLDPAQHGKALAELGCFFCDSRAAWSSHLEKNADTFAIIQTYFENPFKDATQEINALLEDEGATAVLDAGADRMAGVDFATLNKRPQKGQGQLAFLHDTVQVDGAAHHHLVNDVNEPILVIAAGEPAKVQLRFVRPLEQGAEYVHLVGWDGKKSRLRADKDAVSIGQDGQSVTATIHKDNEFSVWKLIISRGPRSLARYQDGLWIAVYATTAPLVAYESECCLSLEQQAWEQKGFEACFECITSDGITTTVQVKRPTDGTTGQEDDESAAFDGDETLSRENIGTSEQPLITWVHWLGDVDDSKEAEQPLEWLEEVTYRPQGHEWRERLIKAFQSNDRYLAAIRHLSPREDSWLVSMEGDLRLSVWRWNEHGEEEGIGRLLCNPDVQNLVRRRKGDGFDWQELPFDEQVREPLKDFLACRQILFSRFHEAAIALRQTRRGRDATVPLGIIDLQAHASLITEYLDAWIAAYEQTTPSATEFSLTHRALLDVDILAEYGEHAQEIRRLTVLPTQPWLLWAQLRYQQTASKELQGMSTSLRHRFNLQLTMREAAQLVYPVPFDDWYSGADGSLHMCRIDGPPFHWCFVPEDHYRQHGGLDYLSRVVRNKIERYLRMHRHLAHQSRTLRIGFINPGDGAHLLEGIKSWVRSQLGDNEGRIPDIEVLIFSTRGSIATAGTAFDDFFKGAFTTAQDDATHVLFQKLRYIKLDREGPKSERDYVHVCFVRDLVRDADFQTRDRRIEDGWDGCFGDGVLATSLRSSRIDGPTRRTERGLWINSFEKNRGRRALAQIATLLRGCSQGSVDPAMGLFWGASVPTLAEQRDVYAYSDWVVHLDRALGLEVFRDFEKQMEGEGVDLPSAPIVVEYSDQEEPDSPGYDTITVTRRAQPYVDQLAKVLEFAGLPIPDDDEVARRCGEGLIRDINAISGTWALDFIEGNMSQDTSSTLLKGHAGVGLTYRWLQRVEAPRLRKRFGGAVVPVYLSLDEIIRATPSVGLPLKEGLLARSREDGSIHKDREGRLYACDDLLVLYLTPVQDGHVHMVGRVIEVKLANAPRQYESKAVSQVQNTRGVLNTYLSGDSTRHDHMFRSKQLSMLLKSRIEQSLVMDPATAQDFAGDYLNRLSAALASGNYHVDYTIGVDGRNLIGDVFLLQTAESDARAGKATIRENQGVRVIELPRPTLYWLAFQPEDAHTLPGAPTDTLPPYFGQYNESNPVMVHFVASGMDVVGDADAQVVSADMFTVPGHGTSGSMPEIPSTADYTLQSVELPPSRVGPAAVTVAASSESESMVQTPTIVNETGSAAASGSQTASETKPLSLADACQLPVKRPSFDPAHVADVVKRLERALEGHKVALESPPSVAEARLGPRLVRVHVRLRPGESIQTVRRISEDLARDVGTQSPDVHVCNVPELHAIGLDLPIDGLSYAVTYEELRQHASFAAARRELALGFCAGIDVTGNAMWTDFADMPHALVAGTTGSGKTVFLRQLLLTLLLHRSPQELQVRLASSKPMDFRLFERAPHAGGTRVASDTEQALALARELVAEMERRIEIINDAACDNLAEYNEESSEEHRLPYLMTIIDEFAETVLSFDDKSARVEFEKAIARLVQKSRATGIHMLLCMQRPDSAVLQGPIKANILHRFALKLPQNHDSRVILDEVGAEALLGQGDLLYKDANNRLFRLQVPNLEKKVLKQYLADEIER